MSDLTGGRAVVELLKAERVRYIFGIVGATFLEVPIDPEEFPTSVQAVRRERPASA